MIELLPVRGIPEIQEGADLAEIISGALASSEISLRDHDVVVVTHKIVSKAEGAVVEVAHGDDAHREVALGEAVSLLRRRGDLVITETRHGFICANSGVDRSNMPRGRVALLPRDPDRSAHTLRRRLEAGTGATIGVVITDTFGRPWRRGLTDVAIGIAGIPAIVDHRGRADSHGRILEVTETAVGDEIAAAADLVMGKTEGVPVAIVRGLDLSEHPAGRGVDLIRPAAEDLFR